VVYTGLESLSDLYGPRIWPAPFRKQLGAAAINVGSSLMERNPAGSETPMRSMWLAKVLPGFTREKRQEALQRRGANALAEGLRERLQQPGMCSRQNARQPRHCRCRTWQLLEENSGVE